MSQRRTGLVETARLASSAAGLFSLRVLGAVAVYATYVVLARWLGASGLGQYAFAASLMILLANVAAFGLPTVAVRFLPGHLANADAGAVDRFISFSRRRAFLGGLAISAVALLFGVIGVPGGGWSGATVVALLAVPLYAVVLIHAGLALGLSRFLLSAVPDTSLRPITLFVVVLLLSMTEVNGSAALVMWIHLAVIAVIVFAQRLLVDRAANMADGTRGPRDRAQERAWTAAAVPLLIAGLASAYLADLVLVLSNVRASAAEIAVLSAAVRTGTLVLFVMIAIDHIVLPQYAAQNATRDRTAMSATLRRATALRVVSVCLAAFSLVVVGRPLLSIFGPGFESGYGAMIIVLIGLALRAAAGGAPELLSATTGAGALMAANLFGLAAGTVAFVATPMLSPVTSGALAYSVATVLVGWTCRWLCLQRLGVDPSVLALARIGRVGVSHVR